MALAPDDIAAVGPPGEMTEASAAQFMQGLIGGFSSNVFEFAHLAMNLWGTAAAFPTLRLTDVFTDDGARVVDGLMRRKCMHALSDTLNYAYGASYRSLLRDQPANVLAWGRAFIAGSVAAVRPAAPFIIYWGTHDTVVPPAMGAAYRRQKCAVGGNVTRVQLAGEQTHFSTPGVAEPLYLAWISDRLAGQPVANGCIDPPG